MNEMNTRVLTGLAQEAQYYARNIAGSMIQLGRVLTEAKPLVKHGQWENWIRENAGCSVRYAQVFMQAYTRFGDNPAVAQIGERGKIFKLLALPSGTEEKFFEENDIARMTAREVENAVQAVKEELRAEQAARRQAEARARELADRPPEVPEEVRAQMEAQAQAIRNQGVEIRRLADMGREAIQEKNRLLGENADLSRELAEQNQMLDDAQRQYDAVRGELLAMQSAAAKGDAERIPAEELTVEVFASAVRQFVGTCARMPHMGKTFSRMAPGERNAYMELLSTMEGWAEGARQAMEEVVDHG